MRRAKKEVVKRKWNQRTGLPAIKNGTTTMSVASPPMQVGISMDAMVKRPKDTPPSAHRLPSPEWGFSTAAPLLVLPFLMAGI